MDTSIVRPRRREPIRSGRVAEKRRRVYERLVREGCAQFVRHGMANVSVQDLIEAADISRTTFYGFFANKAELAAAALEPVFDASALRFEELLGLSPEAVVPGLVDLYLELWTEHANSLLLIGAADESVFPYIETAHEAYVGGLHEVLAHAESGGVLRNDSAEYSRAIVARTGVSLLRIYDGHPEREKHYRDSMYGLLLKRRPATIQS